MILLVVLICVSLGCGSQEESGGGDTQVAETAEVGTGQADAERPASGEQDVSDKTNLLAASLYEDPKGHFRIAPPRGWSVQEYPDDPRGKVAFACPGTNVDLRVLINAVDFSTVDDLVEWCESLESRIGFSTNIERIEFGGRPAVRRSFDAKGMRFLSIDFLVGSVDHNIQYAGQPHEFEKHLSVATTSMETYQALARDVSEDESRQHSIAKMRRLGQLMIETSNYDLALEYIEAGLTLSPEDSTLLKLKSQVESRR
jgi:hypothetical protein